jgi:hypothetical protein
MEVPVAEIDGTSCSKVLRDMETILPLFDKRYKSLNTAALAAGALLDPFYHSRAKYMSNDDHRAAKDLIRKQVTRKKK